MIRISFVVSVNFTGQLMLSFNTASDSSFGYNLLLKYILDDSLPQLTAGLTLIEHWARVKTAAFVKFYMLFVSMYLNQVIVGG